MKCKNSTCEYIILDTVRKYCSYSCAAKGRWENKEFRIIHSARMKSQWKDIEYIEKITKSSTKNALNLHKLGISKPFGRTFSTYDSNKAGIMLLKSGLEVQACKLFDSNPYVLDYTYESVRIPYNLKDGLHTYVVDFKLFWSSGDIELIEVKHSHDLDKEVNVVKFDSARSLCKKRNYIFTILTEKTLFTKKVIKAVND